MRKISLKISLVLVSVITVVVLFSGCSAPTLSRPSQSPGVTTYKISGNCNISINNGVVTVSGQTNIVNGALIQLSVYGQDGMMIDSYNMTKNGDQVTHDFNIADKADKYAKETAVYGFITCAPKLYGNQTDPSVYQTYGEQFQNLDYSDKETQKHYIWEKEGNIIIFQSDVVNIKK